MALIDRQAALDAFNGDLTIQAAHNAGRVYRYLKMVTDRIKALPPVQPKHGKWKDGKCDQCSGSAPFWPLANTYYCSNFCPHCGADMRGEADGQVH